MNLSTFLIIFGLCIDIEGAFFLAKSFMIKSLDQIWEEGSTLIGFNAPFIRSSIFQKHEAIFGFILLFIGFSLQIFGVLIQNVNSNARLDLSSSQIILLLAAVLLIILAICLILTKIISKKKYVGKMKNHFRDDTLKNDPNYLDKLNIEQIISHGERFFLVRHKKNETTEEYKNRVVKFIT